MAAVAGYSKTANTFDPSLDPVLWPMLCLKSQLIDSIPKDSVDNFLFSWESAATNSRRYTAASATVAGSATNTGIVMSDATGLQVGDCLRNVTTPMPLAVAYGYSDEIVQIAPGGISTNTLTVIRAVNGDGTNGSTAAGATDVWEVCYPAKVEGSSPDANRYKDVSQVSAYTQILDLFLQVTGSQMASKRIVAGDTLQRQFDDRVIELMNFVETMILYGAQASTAVGSATIPRTTKGLHSYVAIAAAATNGTLDYTTQNVTEEAINTIMQKMADGGQDVSGKFLLVGNNYNIRKVAAFGADKVRITQNESVWGRAIKALQTDLGVDLELVPCHNCSKTDLFIVNTNKIKLVTFRPFESEEYGRGTSSPNGIDAWCKRYLGEVGLKVVDGAYSQGLLTRLPWS